MGNFQELVDRWLFDPTTGKIVATIAGLIGIYVLVRLLRQNVINRFVSQIAQRGRARRAVNVVGYILAFFYVVAIFSDSLGQLTVFFGVAAAGIAFALQEVIASIAGWVAITLGGFYKIGDRVQLGGIKGDVIDTGLLRTTLVECGDWVNADLYNGRIVRIANSFVFKEPVFNYTANFPFLWDEITIPVKYESDRQLAREILNRVLLDVVGSYVREADSAWEQMALRYMVEDASVEPVVTMVATDNWVEFTLRYVVDYQRRRSTKDRLFSRILDAFDETEGRVSVASMTVHLVQTPTFNVRIAEPE